MAYIGSGLTRFNTADDLTVTDDAEIGGDLTVTGSADINGGTIDGVTIGGASAGAVTATTITGSGDMNIDSGTLFVNASTNNVGIGTTSPAYPLDVVGSTASIQSRYGTATTKFGIFVNDSNNFVSCGSFTNDETRLITNGVDRVLIDESGRVTMPYQPMFSGYRNAGNLASGNVVFHNISLINRGSHYNSANGRFTCPVTGAYFVNIGGHGENSSPSQISVYLNGLLVFEEYTQSSPAYGATSATAIISCNSGDYIEHRVTTGTYWGGNQSGLRMTVKLVG